MTGNALIVLGIGIGPCRSGKALSLLPVWRTLTRGRDFIGARARLLLRGKWFGTLVSSVVGGVSVGLTRTLHEGFTDELGLRD